MLRHEDFEKALNTPFTVDLEDGQQVELKLEAISKLKVTPRQEMFAIYFRGPNEAFLGQGTRSMRHDTMGSMELFLVPVAQDGGGYEYESAFNRIRNSDAESGAQS